MLKTKENVALIYSFRPITQLRFLWCSECPLARLPPIPYKKIEIRSDKCYNKGLSVNLIKIKVTKYSW